MGCFLFNSAVLCCFGALGENVVFPVENSVRMSSQIRRWEREEFPGERTWSEEVWNSVDSVLLTSENAGSVLENGGSLCSVELSAGAFQAGNPLFNGFLCLDCLKVQWGLFEGCLVALWKNGLQLLEPGFSKLQLRQNGVSRFRALFVRLDQLGGTCGPVGSDFLNGENDGFGEILENGGSQCSVELSAGAFQAWSSSFLSLLCLDSLNMVLGSSNANGSLGFFLAQEWAGGDQCRLYSSSVRFVRRSTRHWLGSTNRGSLGQTSVCFCSTRMRVCVCVRRSPGAHGSFPAARLAKHQSFRMPVGLHSAASLPDNANNVSCGRNVELAMAHTGTLRECRVSSISRGVLARVSGTRGPRDGVKEGDGSRPRCRKALRACPIPVFNFKFEI